MFLFLILDENIGNLVSNNYNWHKNNLFFGIQSKKIVHNFHFTAFFIIFAWYLRKPRRFPPSKNI